MQDLSPGPACKGTQVLTINSYGDLGSVTRAYCWGEELHQIPDLWPLQKLCTPPLQALQLWA